MKQLLERTKGNRFINSSPFFNLEIELENHGWHPNLSAGEAEAILSDKAAYTYLIRLDEMQKGFYVSFVSPNGFIQHGHFDLIDPIYGMFRNFCTPHVGSLKKVLNDLMYHSFAKAVPLAA